MSEYMGRGIGVKAGTNDAKLKALHAAARKDGWTGILIPIPQWEGLLLAWMGSRTRQGCSDLTWAMDRLGMIQWEKRVGVILLDQDPLGSELVEEPAMLSPEELTA